MNLDRLDFPHEKENNMSKEGRHDPLLGYEELDSGVEKNFREIYNQALDHSIKIIESYRERDDVFALILNQIIKTINQLKHTDES